MASTDDLIRQILEESKQRQGGDGAQYLGRGGQPHRKKTTVLEDIKSFKEPLGGLADAFAGALRGSVAGTVGFPGDLESLGRGALSALGAPSGARLDALISGMEQPTVLPTTERMRKVLPKATAYDNPYEELGTFMPLPGSTAAARLAGKGAKALGRETGRRINEAMLTGDGMLGAALAPVAPVGVVKGPGGNWLSEGTRAIEGLKGEDAALNNWIDKQLTRYIKNQMATPEDPIRALAEKGTLHFDAPRVSPTERLDKKRQSFADQNNGRWGYGQSQMAQNWEDAADQMINAVPAETYQNFGSSNMTGKPGWEWINKVDPDTPLYGLNNGVSGARERDPSIESLGFPHLIDELRNATNPESGLPRELLIKPESLSKLSVPQAVERVAKINEWRAAQKAEADALRAMNPATFTHKEYPEGYRWVELKQPEGAENTDVLADALKYEGETMGHCVGGYCPDVSEGRSRIYSLRDKKGQPHVTVETSPNGRGMLSGDALNEMEPGLFDKYLSQRYEENGIENMHDWLRTVRPELAQSERIVQIKGKANRAPNEEYLPYVQDFVKSGKWSDVGDIQNTGMRATKSIFNETELQRLRELGETDLPHVMTGEEIQRYHNMIVPEGKRLKYDSSGNVIGVEGGGMKRGGAVKPCNQDAMQMAVWDKAVQHKGIGGWARSAKRSAEEAQRLFDIAKGTRARSAQEAAGLYHPIGGGIKLSKPIELMEFETVKDPTVKGVKRRIITPEKMQGGIGIPLVGDRAAGGKLLTSLEGTQFSEPLTLEAGPDYMLTHTIRNSPESSIWRSGKGIISGLQKQVEMVRDMGRPIYGVNMVGSPTMVNYNTMVAEAILNQYNPAALTKKAKKEFLKDIRNYAPDADKPHLKPGAVLTEADMNDVEALRAKMLAEGAGPLRKAFVERMGLEPFQNMGFPDVSASRLATTEPLLVDVPTGSAGFTIGTIDPAARALAQTPRGHKTYPIALGGEYFGSLESPVDYRNIFQEFADKRRLFGKPEGSDWRSFSLAPQFQTFDQEWLDRYMKSMGASNPREWKKGGVVQKAKGGAVKKAARKAGGSAAKQLVKINPLPKSENLDAMRLAVMDKAVKKAPGGLLRSAAKAAKFVDPPSTKLEDWAWRPLEQVRKDVPITEVPDYVQKGYGQFMKDQMAKAQAGNLSERDLLKAYLITQSSIGRGGLSHSTATKAGLKLPNLGEEVRPEGAFATWLGSKEGQRYLNAAAKGNVDQKAVESIREKFSPFGKQNDLADKMINAVQLAPSMAINLNQSITGSPTNYRNFAEQLSGIAAAKSGFIGSLLGRGDLPTFDARQINLHTKGVPMPTENVGTILARGKGLGGREAVDRQAARQEAMKLAIDPSLDPFYQHLSHHGIWDAIGGEKTTHQDLIDAMRNYVNGGLVKAGEKK